MTTLAEFKTEARALINETTARIILDADLVRWANNAIRDFSSHAHQYERVIAMNVVANKCEYQLAADVLQILLARYQDKYRLKVVDLSDWAAATYFNANPTGIPSIASLSPHDKIIRLWAPPSSSAVTTTVGIGGINDTVTTIPVTSTTGFPRRGKILIGSEQIHYDNIDSTNFLICRRGDGDTTAAAAIAGATVTAGDLVLTAKAIPPTLAVDGDIAKFPTAYENAIPHFMAWKAEIKRSNHDRAKFHQEEYARIREECSKEMFWNAQDGSPAVKDEETGMGFYGLV